MPTTRTRYVNTASTAGGDGTTNDTAGANRAYATLNAAILAEGALVPNLVGSDILLEILCSGTSADTTALVFSSWSGFTGTMDATRYVLIRPHPGQEHGGFWNTGVYRLHCTDASAFALPADASPTFYIVVRGLQIRSTATTGSTNRRALGASGGIGVNGTHEIHDCIVIMEKTGGTGTGHRAFGIEDNNWTILISNSIFIGIGTDCAGVIKTYTAGSGPRQARFHNCTFTGFTTAFQMTDDIQGNVDVRNCLVHDCGAFKSGTVVVTGNFNSTDLGSATGGANDRVSQTFTFVNEGALDFRLTSADGGAKDFGENLSGNANLPVTDDVNGTARPQGSAFDIGFHEVTVGGGALLFYAEDGMVLMPMQRHGVVTTVFG